MGGDAFTPLLMRVSPILVRLSFFETAGLFFTSVKKLLPMPRSSLVGIDGRYPRGVYLPCGEKKFVYEGRCKPDILPGERDI